MPNKNLLLIIRKNEKKMSFAKVKISDRIKENRNQIINTKSAELNFFAYSLKYLQKKNGKTILFYFCSK